VKYNALFCVVVLTIFAQDATLTAQSTALQTTTPVQRFVCQKGYRLEKCLTDIVILRQAVANYPVAELGEWTWILVRSEDWKSIVVPRGLDPDSPAFTYFAKRETFLEEALVAEVPVERRTALLKKWGMTLPELLDFAVAHELGHVLCNEIDETKASRAARMLQAQKPLTCATQLASKAPFTRMKKER
jgi:hypothetical protein